MVFLSFLQTACPSHGPGLSSTNMSTKTPWIFIVTHSLPGSCFMCICVKALGTSTVAASQFSWASITPVIMTLSNDAVGLADSSLFIHPLWTDLLAQVLDFVMPSLFSTKNVNVSIALFFSLGVSALVLVGWKHTLLCGWLILPNALFCVLSPHFLMPFFRPWFCRNY